MKKYLLLTVGGSCEPIVSSILSIKPNFVYFICSDDSNGAKGSYTVINGEGKPCTDRHRQEQPEDKKLNVLKQTRSLNYEYEIIKIKEFDDLNVCFETCYNLIKKVLKNNDVEIVADYTGGTKSMTAGLATAATNFPEVKLNFMTGARVDLNNVVPGTQTIKISTPLKPFIDKTLENVNLHISNYHYQSAINLLEQILKIPNLENQIHSKITSLKNSLIAFSKWDIFQHQDALTMLNTNRREFVNQVIFLEKTIKSAEALLNNKTDLYDRNNISGYEVLIDLIENANRRADQERFDDAIARMYRSLELFLQIYLLKSKGIDTGNVDLSKTPKTFQKKKENCKYKIQIGLREAYELITMYDNEPLKNIFQEYDKKILNALQKRNFSILAHGFIPLTKEDYNDVKVILEFINNCLKELNVKIEPPKFPKSIKDLSYE